MSGPIRDEWLPSPDHLKDWFEEMLLKLNSDPEPKPFNSVLTDFKNFVYRNPEKYQRFNEMIDQAEGPKVRVLRTHVLTYSHQWIGSQRTLM
jgi:hypothetical protein